MSYSISTRPFPLFWIQNPKDKAWHIATTDSKGNNFIPLCNNRFEKALFFETAPKHLEKCEECFERGSVYSLLPPEGLLAAGGTVWLDYFDRQSECWDNKYAKAKVLFRNDTVALLDNGPVNNYMVMVYTERNDVWLCDRAQLWRINKG